MTASEKLKERFSEIDYRKVVRGVVLLSYNLVVILALINSMTYVYTFRSSFGIATLSGALLLYSFSIVLTVVNLIRPETFNVKLHCSCGYQTLSARRFKKHVKDDHNEESYELFRVD